MNEYQNIKVAIYTLGCKVNQYESEAILEAFEQRGFLPCRPDEVCDIYVINTCTVTAESDRKARQFIRRVIHRNPEAYVLVTGCMAQTAADSIASIEGVDYIGGNAKKLDIVSAAEQLVRQKHKNPHAVIHVTPLDHAPFEHMTITKFDRTRAYVKIEDGCESRCTYCIIPDARGNIRSKPIADVLEEVRELVRNGCREVVLTGIETASYGKDLENQSLADLLIAMEEIEGLERVRLGSLDPSLLKPAFVQKIAPLRKLCPHFHISMQSGSSSVLARMKRKYNADQALSGMNRLREVMPQVQFTTDMIVGFPQETEEEFAQTLAFAEQAQFLMIHVFPYSKRKGTPAADMPGQVSEEIKHQRTTKLIIHASHIRAHILQELIRQNQIYHVLFESYSDGMAWGHTPEFIEVAVPSDHPLHGQAMLVTLTEHRGDYCLAAPLTQDTTNKED